MKTIAIIGSGEMGEWFAKAYRRMPEGYFFESILLYDIDESTAREAAKKTGARAATLEECLQSPEILFAISTEDAVGFVRAHQGQLKGKTIYDIVSVKNGLLPLLGETSINSFSLHPMWGGATNELANQNLIIMPTRVMDEYYSRFFDQQCAFFEKLGANVIGIESGEKHDRLMAWNLAFYHASLLGLGYALSQSGISMSEHRKVEGTTGTLARVAAESVAHSNRKLYADIQMKNPYVKEALDAYLHAFTLVRDSVIRQDRAGFTGLMDQAKQYFLEGKSEKLHRDYAERQFAAAAGAAKRVEYTAQHPGTK